MVSFFLGVVCIMAAIVLWHFATRQPKSAVQFRGGERGYAARRDNSAALYMLDSRYGFANLVEDRILPDLLLISPAQADEMQAHFEMTLLTSANDV